MSGTRQKTLGEQLSQTLVAEGRGEALDAEAEDAEPLMAKPASESPALAEQLMEEVCDRGNLERAWKRVRSNKGSPGVDGMTIDAAKDYLREHWPNIRAQLLEGTYQPQPVKRVEIPKPDGGIRKLGVPCVVDRLIQQAMLQVLQERWDPTFSEHSYGFRPGRSAHQAVAQAQRYIADGYNVVVDLDLEKFFDRVNHDSLMARVAARVSDKLVLKLIRAFLNAGVMEDGLVRPVDEGTPQGGPLSPILSNLVLDDLDKELARRGHRFCRYADDCNIYVRSRRAGERVMASVSRFLTNKLRLKVNEAKSAVARPEERKFLGFSISNDGSERRIAPKALDTFKERIRDMTRRTRGFGLQQLIKELKPYIVGWRGYFGFCQTPRSPHKPRSVDPSKIACVSLAAMANQAKPLRGVTPSRRSKVPSGGRGWFTNRVMAHVRTPGGPTSPTQRLFRDARSSPNLCARPSLTRSNRRGTGPVCPVVWEGWRREASPYPDQSPNKSASRAFGITPQIHFTFCCYIIRLSWVSCSSDLLIAQGGANMNGPEILHLIRHDLQGAVALQGHPPTPRPMDASPWVAMSALQKAIRRGREDLALSAATTLLSDAPDKLWRRIGCIAYEDVGLASLEAVGLATVALAGKRHRTALGGE